jgi:Fe-S-cluster containining protein
MSDDRKGKTYSFDVCAPCVLICCQDANPPLTQKRMKLISSFLKEQNIPTKNVFVREGHTHPATDAKGICIFYNKDTRRCKVHSVKPETCKAGPITFDINLQTRKVEFYLKKDEICALAQTIHSDYEQFKVHFEAAKVDIMHLICELESDALKELLTIPEPQTFKIAEDDLPLNVAKKLKIM